MTGRSRCQPRVTSAAPTSQAASSLMPTFFLWRDEQEKPPACQVTWKMWSFWGSWGSHKTYSLPETPGWRFPILADGRAQPGTQQQALLPPSTGFRSRFSCHPKFPFFAPISHSGYALCSCQHPFHRLTAPLPVWSIRFHWNNIKVLIK